MARTEARIQRSQERRAAREAADAAAAAAAAAGSGQSTDAPPAEPTPADPSADPPADPSAEPDPPAPEPESVPSSALDIGSTPDAPDVPQTNLRVEEAKREVWVDPPPGRAALEADESAPVKLVPQAERASSRAARKRARLQKDLDETKQAIDSSETPSLSMEVLQDAGIEVVDWETDISSEESCEICVPDPVFQGKDPADIPQLHVASASSSKEPLQKLAAPPLYAAEVSARASQLTPTVKQEFNKALDLCEQIQGALSQSQSTRW